MNAHKSLFLVAGLGLAACSSPSVQDSTPRSAVENAKLTVTIVEASGGG